MLMSFQNQLHDREVQDKIRQIRRIIDRKLKHMIDGFEIPLKCFYAQRGRWCSFYLGSKMK
jgi:hypothetical protein